MTGDDTWIRALGGDRDAFHEAVRPYRPAMLAAAHRMIDAEAAAGTLRASDLTPEELVGEALLAAWTRRGDHDPARLRPRAWLLGLQTRALARFARQEARYTRRKALSLDEVVPSPDAADAVGDALYDFRQPFDVTTYADLIPGSTPVDIEAGAGDTEPLSSDEISALADSGLDVDGRAAVLLHDEFSLSLAETAQVIDASLHDTAALLNRARTALGRPTDDLPLPDDPDDAHDSYTGDPV
jgi:RNA polymerase sigma-70 factor (ECF subfamily)